MPAFKTVFFDLFNTLLTVGSVPASVGRFTADILGFDHEQWNAACFGEAHDICKPTDHFTVIRTLAHSIDPAIPDHLIEQATIERQARFDFALCNIDSEVLATVRQLKRRSMRLCLISNASTAEVAAWQDSPLAEVFDAAVFSCECGMQKPDTAIFEHALQTVEADQRYSLFVGDGGSNEFVGAHAVGLTTVLTTQFSRLSHQEKVLQHQAGKIHRQISHIRELVDLCK